MNLALVHLARQANGINALDRFLTAYSAVAAGADHELVVLLKGYEEGAAYAEARRSIAQVGAREVRVSDVGTDLTAYAHAARTLEHDTLCLVNSFSVPLADGWLGKLTDPLSSPSVGAVGATGSWASTLEYGLWQAGLRGPYGRSFPNRGATNRLYHSANGLRSPGRLQFRVDNLRSVTRLLRTGARFPAAHLRTNALAMSRSVLATLVGQVGDSKREAYALESGRHSITRRLAALGRLTLLADRDGETWLPADWPDARAFWQAGQEGLLVADNQTRLYDRATPDEQAVLSRYAWGTRGRSA